MHDETMAVASARDRVAQHAPRARQDDTIDQDTFGEKLSLADPGAPPTGANRAGSATCAGSVSPDGGIRWKLVGVDHGHTRAPGPHCGTGNCGDLDQQ